jgi:hypothetical protein
LAGFDLATRMLSSWDDTTKPPRRHGIDVALMQVIFCCGKVTFVSIAMFSLKTLYPGGIPKITYICRYVGRVGHT